MHVSQPLIKPDTLEARAYQMNITGSCLENSTLVVIPTGLGKTVIAAMVIAHVLHSKGGKVLFMAPTKPLVEQHANTLRALLTVGPVTMFTGELAPHERLNQWKDSPVIVSTPQVILNDLISGAMTLDDFNLIIYDEAHRAMGNYAYVFIAEKYRSKAGLALGITASPGSTAEKILEVCNNLDMKRVEIRREYDPDVLPYVHDIRVFWRDVELPADMKRVVGHISAAFNKQVKALQGFGLLRKGERHSMKELLEAQRTIRQRMAQSSPRPPQSLFFAATVQAAAVQINHALELIETQGTAALMNYLDRMEEKATGRGASRSAGIVMKDEDVIKARYLATHFTGEHPKIETVGKVVGGQLRRHPGSRIIVFTHYRDTSELVVARLEKIEGCRPVRFVGQASKGEDAGLSQKEQAGLIEKFKKGTFNTLVATSVGEEGLDIPSTELVVFFEPVASEIRTIQRRGRTGRKMPGKVVILIAKGTRDEAYRWAAFNKERRMMRELDILRRQLSEKIAVGFPKAPDIGQDFRTADDTGVGAGEPIGAIVDTAAVDDRGDGEMVDVGAGDDELIGQPGDTGNSEVGADAGVEDAGNGDGKGNIGIEDVKAWHSPKPTNPEMTGSRQDGGISESVRRRAIEILENAGPAGENDGARPHGLERNPEPSPRGQLRLGDFPAEKEEPLTVIVDHREFNSGVVRELSRSGVRVVPVQLPVADFVLSDRVGVERKEVHDFVGSLLDGRLFHQLRDLRGAYIRPLIIIEGEGLFGLSGMSQESIMGALACIVTDYGVPTIFTKDDKQTAALLLAIVKRERDEGRIPAIRGDKGSMSLPERQQFIVEGLPHVSGTLSQRLLARLGSVRNILNADVEELCRVKGVGRKTAEEIVRTVQSEYLAASSAKDRRPAGRKEVPSQKDEEE
jgi:Fanconi anemia group M protein